MAERGGLLVEKGGGSEGSVKEVDGRLARCLRHDKMTDMLKYVNVVGRASRCVIFVSFGCHINRIRYYGRAGVNGVKGMD